LPVEAGIPMGWRAYAGDHGVIIAMDTFGASAPAPRLFEEFGFTSAHILARARALLTS
jgi:transketolase